MTTEKNEKSHISGNVEPGKYELNIDEVDLTKRYSDWQDGYTVPKEQPGFSKIKPNDREG